MDITAGDVIGAATCWFCAAIFVAFGVYVWRIRKNPAWFYTGVPVNDAEIADVPAFNRANGRMWLVYAALWLIDGLLFLVEARIGAFAMIPVVVPCTFPMLFIAYGRIYKKYKT